MVHMLLQGRAELSGAARLPLLVLRASRGRGPTTAEVYLMGPVVLLMGLDTVIRNTHTCWTGSVNEILGVPGMGRLYNSHSSLIMTTGYVSVHVCILPNSSASGQTKTNYFVLFYHAQHPHARAMLVCLFGFVESVTFSVCHLYAVAVFDTCSV